MHFPLDLNIAGVVIKSHLIFELLAYTLGFRYYLYLRKKEIELINDENRVWIFIGAAFGGLVVSRLLGIFENINLLSASPNKLIFFMSSKTIVGGLLGGLAGVEITKKIIGVKTSSGDLMTYPLILGIITGRIGCFLAGIEDGTYGLSSNLPWAMNLGDGIYRHPTNLYEILFLGFLWIFIRLLEKNTRLANGSRFKIFLSTYLLFRFSVEFIKPSFNFSFGLSPIQIACLAGIIYYYRVFLYPYELFERENSDA